MFKTVLAGLELPSIKSYTNNQHLPGDHHGVLESFDSHWECGVSMYRVTLKARWVTLMAVLSDLQPPPQTNSRYAQSG